MSRTGRYRAPRPDKDVTPRPKRPRRDGARGTRESQAERNRRDRVRAEVFARDGWQCVLAGVDGVGACALPLTFQHRQKAGQGGEFTVENGTTLCGHHNTAVESDARIAAIAKARGVVVESWQNPAEIPLVVR